MSGFIYLIEGTDERMGALFFTDPLLESAQGNYRTGLNFRDLMNSGVIRRERDNPRYMHRGAR
jgi:hypothetical protein